MSALYLSRRKPFLDFDEVSIGLTRKQRRLPEEITVQVLYGNCVLWCQRCNCDDRRGISRYQYAGKTSGPRYEAWREEFGRKWISADFEPIRDDYIASEIMG